MLIYLSQSICVGVVSCAIWVSQAMYISMDWGGYMSIQTSPKDYKFTSRPKKRAVHLILSSMPKPNNNDQGSIHGIITVHIPSPEYSWWHLQQYQQPERQTQLLSEQQANYDDKSTIMDNQCFHHNRSIVLSQQISVKQETCYESIHENHNPRNINNELKKLAAVKHKYNILCQQKMN
jgi:hypothetical protein